MPVLAIVAGEQDLFIIVNLQVPARFVADAPKVRTSELGMSGRTLQRRLSERGQSFQSLVDLSRRDFASQLLRETEYSLAEIAFLTGFSEQSGFTRAFKRWQGQTPRSYRLAST